MFTTVGLQKNGQGVMNRCESWRRPKKRRKLQIGSRVPHQNASAIWTFPIERRLLIPSPLQEDRRAPIVAGSGKVLYSRIRQNRGVRPTVRGNIRNMRRTEWHLILL